MDVMDAMDAILGAQAHVAEFKREYMEHWNMPLIKAQLKAKWNTLTPDQKDALKAQNQEAYTAIERFFSS